MTKGTVIHDKQIPIPFYNSTLVTDKGNLIRQMFEL